MHYMISSIMLIRDFEKYVTTWECTYLLFMYGSKYLETSDFYCWKVSILNYLCTSCLCNKFTVFMKSHWAETFQAPKMTPYFWHENNEKISWTFLLSQKQNVKIIMETKMDKLQLRFQNCFDTHNMANLFGNLRLRFYWFY